MGTNCAPFVTDLFLYCYERDFMLSLDKHSHLDLISAFNDTSRYSDDIVNIDNPFFDNNVPIIHPKELKCDVIYEKIPYCGTNIIGPDQTPRMMRGV